MTTWVKVCMLSSNHSLLDDRIYWKEALTLKENGYDVIHIGAGSEDLDYTSPEGIRLIQVKKEPGTFKPAAWLFSSRSIYRKILAAAAGVRADVYHLHDWQLSVIARRLKGLAHHPKLIYDSHDATAPMLASEWKGAGIGKGLRRLSIPLISHWEKRTTRYYDALITAEEYTARLLRRSTGLPPTITLYNYSYFPPDDIPAATSFPQYHVIYSGLITQQRGILELLEATRLLKETKPEIKTLVIGFMTEDGFKDLLEKKIIDEGLEKNFFLHPAVPFRDMADYYRQCGIGICTWHPSEKNLQAIPIKLFEYMAFGLPVILTNKGVATRFIKEANSGLLVDPYSPMQIAAAIMKLLNDPLLSRQMSRNGKEAVRNKYSWRHEESKLLELYNHVLSGI